MTRKLISACLMCATLAAAAPLALEADASKTTVEFTLGATLHSVHGSFALRRGALQFDPDSGKVSGELVVDATSGKTGNDTRDAKMHKDVLESARYPDIVFRPDHLDGKVNPQGASSVQLHGIFSIHGADHEMTVPLDLQLADNQYTATAHITVPYQKWGMKNPSTFVLRVSDKVDLTIHASAHVRTETTQR